MHWYQVVRYEAVWLKVSKAFFEALKRLHRPHPLCLLETKSFQLNKVAVSVQWCALKPCCWMELTLVLSFGSRWMACANYSSYCDSKTRYKPVARTLVVYKMQRTAWGLRWEISWSANNFSLTLEITGEDAYWTIVWYWVIFDLTHTHRWHSQQLCRWQSYGENLMFTPLLNQ